MLAKVAAAMAQRLGPLLVAMLPAATILVLIYVLFDTTIFHDYPSRQGVWNDEIYYWHQIASFKAYGFDSGYYTYQELVGPGFVRFGAHGPVLPILYGLIGRLTGWQLYSLALFHLVAITLSAWCYVHFTHLRGLRLLTAGILLVTFWPLMVFAATGMQEGLHYTIALLLAILFWRIMAVGEALTPGLRAACLAFLAGITLLRPTWSVLFIPYFVYTSGRSPRKVLLALVKAGVAILLLYGVFSLITAPYPYGWLAYLQRVPGLAVKIDALKGHTIGNLRHWVDSSYNVRLELLQHYQILALLLLLGIVGIVRAILFAARHRNALQVTNRLSSWLATDLSEVPLLFHAANLGLVFLMNIVFYEIGAFRDYRVLAPHLLLSLLIVLARGKRFWPGIVGLLMLSNVVLAPTFFHDYGDWRRDAFTYNQHDMEALYGFNQTLSSFMSHEPGKDPWCNTLLSSFPSGTGLGPMPPIMLGVPAGIGISVDYGSGVAAPLKSRYVLTTPANAERLAATTHLRFLTSTQYYNLYLNLDAPCG
jgi:hypothetical protein